MRDDADLISSNPSSGVSTGRARSLRLLTLFEMPCRTAFDLETRTRSVDIFYIKQALQGLFLRKSLIFKQFCGVA